MSLQDQIKIFQLEEVRLIELLDKKTVYFYDRKKGRVSLLDYDFNFKGLVDLDRLNPKTGLPLLTINSIENTQDKEIVVLVDDALVVIALFLLVNRIDKSSHLTFFIDKWSEFETLHAPRIEHLWQELQKSNALKDDHVHIFNSTYTIQRPSRLGRALELTQDDEYDSFIHQVGKFSDTQEHYQAETILLFKEISDICLNDTFRAYYTIFSLFLKKELFSRADLVRELANFCKTRNLNDSTQELINYAILYRSLKVGEHQYSDLLSYLVKTDELKGIYLAMKRAILNEEESLTLDEYLSSVLIDRAQYLGDKRCLDLLQ